MEKKAYLIPSVAVEEMGELCQVTKVSGAGMSLGGGGNGPARAPQVDDVCDDDEEEVAENNPMVSVSEYVRQSKLYKAWED